MNHMNQLKKGKWGLRRLFLMGLLLLAKSDSALAQVSASITGRIEDASGATIPEATVVVTSLETGVPRTVTTDAAGNYRVLSLPMGRYEVRAEKAGFKAAVQTGITLVVGQQAVLNLRLEVGEVQQQVTVTGEVPLVNTTTSSVSGLVGEKEVKKLPLNGRSFDMLITLHGGGRRSVHERRLWERRAVREPVQRGGAALWGKPVYTERGGVHGAESVPLGAGGASADNCSA